MISSRNCWLKLGFSTIFHCQRGHGNLNNAKTKKKTLKSNLYYTCWNTLKRKRDGGPIFATLRLGIEQHSRMIHD